MVNSRLWNYYSYLIWQRSLFDYWCSVIYCSVAAYRHLALFLIVEVSLKISEWFFFFFDSSILFGNQNFPILFWSFYEDSEFLSVFFIWIRISEWFLEFLIGIRISKKKNTFLLEFLVEIRNSILRGSEFLNNFWVFLMGDQNFWVFFGLLHGDQNFWMFFGLLYGDQNF